MDFELTDRCKDHIERVEAFMDEHVYPAEPVYETQMRESGDPHFHPPILEELNKRPSAAGCGTSSIPIPSGAPACSTPSTRRWPRSWAAARTSRPRR